MWNQYTPGNPEQVRVVLTMWNEPHDLSDISPAHERSLKPELNRTIPGFSVLFFPWRIAARHCGISGPVPFADWGRDDNIALAIPRMSLALAVFITVILYFPTRSFADGFASFWLGARCSAACTNTGPCRFDPGPVPLGPLASFWILLGFWYRTKIDSGLSRPCQPAIRAIGTGAWWSPRFVFWPHYPLPPCAGSQPRKQTGLPALGWHSAIAAGLRLRSKEIDGAVPAIVC